MQCMMFTFDAKCQPCFALSIIYTGTSAKRRSDEDETGSVAVIKEAFKHKLNNRVFICFCTRKYSQGFIDKKRENWLMLFSHLIIREPAGALQRAYHATHWHDGLVPPVAACTRSSSE